MNGHCLICVLKLDDHYCILINLYSFSTALSGFCGSHNLLDPWHLNHPDTKQYSWFKPKSIGIKSIIVKVVSDNAILFYYAKWKFLKFKIREYSIHFGKTLSKNSKSEDNQTNKHLL